MGYAGYLELFLCRLAHEVDSSYGHPEEYPRTFTRKSSKYMSLTPESYALEPSKGRGFSDKKSIDTDTSGKPLKKCIFFESFEFSLVERKSLSLQREAISDSVSEIFREFYEYGECFLWRSCVEVGEGETICLSKLCLVELLIEDTCECILASRGSLE